jgi:hypothetical protein
MDKPWYNDFLSRLKVKDKTAYDKEVRKHEKSHKLNPIIEFDEDLL